MSSCIYIIRQGSSRLFKLGVSKCPEQRLKTLQTGNPAKLKLLFTVPCTDAFKVEAIVHDHLKDHRVLGEWFHIESDDKVVEVAQAIQMTSKK